MLHNSGPYGPNDVPINMGAPVNMTQMSNPMNLGNLAKMPQQAPQTSAPLYNMPDFSSFGHPPLSVGHSISPFPNYHHLNFQTNYGHPNSNLTQDTTANNVQNSMLPMNLNITSDHGPSLMNYESYESKRLDVNNAQYKEDLTRKMPINIPQVHTKAFHKQLGMDSTYGQYNSIQENPFYSQDLSKTPEKSLIDNTRRKSLENTVKLIENILINSTPKEKSKSSNSTSSLTDNKHLNNTSIDMRNMTSQSEENVMKSPTANPSVHKDSSKNLRGTNLNQTQNVDMHDHDVNVDKTDLLSFSSEIKHSKTSITDLNVNLSTKNEIPNQIIDLKTTGLEDTNVSDSVEGSKHSTIHNSAKTSKKKSHKNTKKEPVTKIQSEIHCEPLRRSLMNNIRVVPVDKLQKDRDDNTDSEIDEPIAEINIKTEFIEDDTVKVKVEPLERSEDNVPFLRDPNATDRDILEDDAVIIEENAVAEAQEYMKMGSQINTYFECPHCNLLFEHPKRFLIHTKWHSFGLTNEKRQALIRVKEMKKNMKREAKIIERLNSKEVKEGAEGDVHPCKDCDKVFTGKSSLKNHRQRYHPTRMRTCALCGAAVLGWLALRAHTAAAHAPGAPHACAACPKRFKYAHSLAKHRDTHLEKTHACTQCEKKFGSQALLKMHMKCHERTARGATFRCTYCAKGFFESYNLQVHERTHRNERPFTCDICKTSFGTNSSLKRHLKVSHNTSKPFPCPTCQRCFASTTTRARHMTRVHGNKKTTTTAEEDS